MRTVKKADKGKPTRRVLTVNEFHSQIDNPPLMHTGINYEDFDNYEVVVEIDCPDDVDMLEYDPIDPVTGKRRPAYIIRGVFIDKKSKTLKLVL